MSFYNVFVGNTVMSSYPIFSVLGIEIEYMIVDKYSLKVQPISDTLLKALAGTLTNEVALGDIAISNELVMHVLELKNNGPKPPKTPIREQFQKAILDIQGLLEQHQVILLPSGAHPFMDPYTETQRWPHGNNAIYKQYDRIFDCKGHGWANLQSMHVNLPFANAEEFFHLHNVIRLILPLIPALAASSPILDGKPTGMLDARLHYYGKNQQRIPAISGQVIPEFIRSETEYQDRILKPMYEAIRPFDPKGLLCQEWLNSRAAIAKFAHNCIEIRIIDSQECVNADIAIATAIHAILKHWHASSHYFLEHPCDTLKLRQVYDNTITSGLSTLVEDRELLTQWQLPKRCMTVGQIWSHLIEQVSSDLEPPLQLALEHILSKGNLAQRILKALKSSQDSAALLPIYNQLGFCLLTNSSFS